MSKNRFKPPQEIINKINSENANIPNKDIEKIISRIFTLIINKATDTGECVISGFGKLLISTRTDGDRIIPSVKFKISRHLKNKLADDEYVRIQLGKNVNKHPIKLSEEEYIEEHTIIDLFKQEGKIILNI